MGKIWTTTRVPSIDDRAIYASYVFLSHAPLTPLWTSTSVQLGSSNLTIAMKRRRARKGVSVWSPVRTLWRPNQVKFYGVSFFCKVFSWRGWRLSKEVFFLLDFLNTLFESFLSPFIHWCGFAVDARHMEWDVLDNTTWQSLLGAQSNKQLSTPTRRDGAGWLWFCPGDVDWWEF